MKYEVTSPEGKKFEVTAPDGATQDQVLQYAQSQFQQPQQQSGMVNAFTAPSFLGAVGQNAKTIGQAVINPETYKKIGHDLANFPPIEDQKKLFQSPEAMKQAMDVALSTLPITSFAKASRMALAGKSIEPVKKSVLQMAQQQGLKVSPSEVNPSMTNVTLESISGKAATAQKVSAKNQKVFTDLITKDLGLPKDTPLTPELLKSVRDNAGKVYEQAKNLGVFTVDKAFKTSLRDIAKTNSAVAKEVPGLLDKGVVDLTNQFARKKVLSAEATVEAIKQLRSSASDNFVNNQTLARAQRALANQLEGLMERNIAKANAPDFLKAFRDARQLIAKTYTAEKALVGGEVSGAKLARELQKGKPLSGGMKQIAQFAQQFPRASQLPSKTGAAGVSKLQALESALFGGGGYAALGPAGLGAAAIPVAAPPLARLGLLSDVFQKSLIPSEKASNMLVPRGLLGFMSQ